jgi:hypothetical protein
MERKLFISELRAVLAYLETHRDEIRTARAWPWSYSGRVQSSQAELVDVNFQEAKRAGDKSSGTTKESVRLIKR